MTWIAFFLLAMSVLVVLMLLFSWYARLLTDRIVNRKLAWIETIFSTGEPPADWKTQKRGITHRDIRRLDRLCRYVARTALTVDETTREEVAAKLAETRAQWILRILH